MEKLYSDKYKIRVCQKKGFHIPPSPERIHKPKVFISFIVDAASRKEAIQINTIELKKFCLDLSFLFGISFHLQSDKIICFDTSGHKVSTIHDTELLFKDNELEGIIRLDHESIKEKLETSSSGEYVFSTTSSIFKHKGFIGFVQMNRI
jgi:hypothetical protein